VTFESATATQGSCSESGGTVTCVLGTLPDGEGASVQITVRPPSAGSITNQASVTSDVADPATSNNSASAGTTVNATAVGYPRPKGATPMYTSLVPAYTECTAPNSTHGAPLDSAACKPATEASGFLTTGTPDANGQGSRMQASAMLTTRPGLAGPTDEADVGITVTVSDVRNRADLTDYTGELEGRLALRLTDRVNGTTLTDSATVADEYFTFAVPCAATSATNIGATCSLNSTADAVLPGSVVEDKRTIWQLGDVRLYDGGPDGLAATQDNTLFLRQGVFVP
jgi:Domain of unknown function DUF11